MIENEIQEPAPSSTPSAFEAADSEATQETENVVDQAASTPHPAPVAMNRNKQLTPEVDVLGDVHLGKKFVTGVPIEKRGRREGSVWADFEASLLETKARYHVQVGDLFDALTVPNAVVLRAAKAYRHAAHCNPNTKYFVYAGNHDASRTDYIKSSFDVFAKLVNEVPNIHAMTNVVAMDGLAFIPWHPFISAADLATKILADGKYDVVFGHWDCTSFGGDDHNLIPLEQLAGKTNLVVTGHEHNAREFDHGDIHVVVTGSMQPYSHAEDPDSEIYVTLTLDELTERQDEDFSNRNVRVVLKEGEVIPADIDALSVSCKTVTEENKEIDIDVDFDAFDLGDLLNTSLTEIGVTDQYRTKINEKFGELKAE